jgi:hypothetical protein
VKPKKVKFIERKSKQWLPGAEGWGRKWMDIGQRIQMSRYKLDLEMFSQNQKPVTR